MKEQIKRFYALILSFVFLFSVLGVSAHIHLCACKKESTSCSIDTKTCCSSKSGKKCLEKENGCKELLVYKKADLKPVIPELEVVCADYVGSSPVMIFFLGFNDHFSYDIYLPKVPVFPDLQTYLHLFSELWKFTLMLC
jgi:hypothetical protein